MVAFIIRATGLVLIAAALGATVAAAGLKLVHKAQRNQTVQVIDVDVTPVKTTYSK